VSLKNILLRFIQQGTTLHRILGRLKQAPFSSLFVIAYTIYLTKRATGDFFPIRFFYSGRFIPVIIQRAKSGAIIIQDKVILESWLCGNDSITINVGEHAQLKVCGEFVIGQGTKIVASSGARIEFKGKLTASASGITCDTLIMAEQLIEIGYDSIIAWGCSISDSNWHELTGTKRCVPVKIGDSVWIAHDVTVLPGSIIGNGCVVGAKSLVLGGEYESKNILAGVPARVVRENVMWER
jgi:acetyltransferase-like isoleucine patch superfamily enzyme